MHYAGNGQVKLYNYVRATGQGSVEYSEIDTDTTPSEVMTKFFSAVLNEIRLTGKSSVLIDRKEIHNVSRDDVKGFISSIPSQSLGLMIYYFFSTGNWQAEGIGEETDLSVIIHEILQERGEE
jgi:hypothetical protein